MFIKRQVQQEMDITQAWIFKPMETIQHKHTHSIRVALGETISLTANATNHNLEVNKSENFRLNYNKLKDMRN